MTVRSICLSFALVGTAGCAVGNGQGSALASSSGPDAALKFLQWSMDRYAAMHSFHGTADLTIDPGMVGYASQAYKREVSIDYQAPNKYRVTMTIMGIIQATICDGKVQTTYPGVPGVPVQSLAAPASMASVEACTAAGFGANIPLLTVFGGSSKIAGLVDLSKHKVAFGAEETRPDGEKAREVRFYGAGPIGNCTVLIGEKTGLCYRWLCDMAPVLAQMGIGSGSKGAKNQAMTPKKLDTTFLITLAKPNAPIDASLFDTKKPPKGRFSPPPPPPGR